MELLEQLHWRYATKKMDPTKAVPQEKVDRILEAVREGAGERAASLIEHLKKGDMAKEAERLLADTGWLPEPLRLVDLDGDAVDGGDDRDGEALPEFLAGDGDDDEAGDAEEEEAVLVAAE